MIPGPVARAQDAGCQLRQGPRVPLWQSGAAESSDPVQSLQCRAVTGRACESVTVGALPAAAAARLGPSE